MATYEHQHIGEPSNSSTHFTYTHISVHQLWKSGEYASLLPLVHVKSVYPSVNGTCGSCQFELLRQ